MIGDTVLSLLYQEVLSPGGARPKVRGTLQISGARTRPELDPSPQLEG